MENYRILAINPGSTSTKIAVYENENLLKELTLRHSAEELKEFDGVMDQFGWRKDIIIKALEEAGIELVSIHSVIGRGGLVKPIPSGVYEINNALRRDLRDKLLGEHASNLGGLIAADIAQKIGVNAYIADPVVVDELQDVARVSGLPHIERISIFHALNQKAIARVYAERIGKKYEELNLIIAHLGGGISVGAHRKGLVVDVNNALDGEGPITPERSGTLPAGQLMRMCMSGKYTEGELKKLITGAGGLVAWVGTNNEAEVEDRMEAGDEKAKLLVDAMAYTIGKSIGAMSAVLHGEVDAIIMTGGIARSQYVCEYVRGMVSKIGEYVVIPGENELEALAMNALRVLRGEETPKVYS